GHRAGDLTLHLLAGHDLPLLGVRDRNLHLITTGDDFRAGNRPANLARHLALDNPLFVAGDDLRLISNGLAATGGRSRAAGAATAAVSDARVATAVVVMPAPERLDGQADVRGQGHGQSQDQQSFAHRCRSSWRTEFSDQRQMLEKVKWESNKNLGP